MSRFLHQCSSVFIRGFKWLLVGLVCFCPKEKQIFRRASRAQSRGTRPEGWPGQECLVCGHWHPFDVLVPERPSMRRTVRPQGERAHLREEAARLHDRLEVLELEQMTHDYSSGRAGAKSLLPRPWRTQ